MYSKKCNDCYFRDVCSGRRVCNGFTPVTLEGEDAAIDDTVEQERLEYREAWFAYLKEWED